MPFITFPKPVMKNGDFKGGLTNCYRKETPPVAAYIDTIRTP